jgi:hypothetical protein
MGANTFPMILKITIAPTNTINKIIDSGWEK